MAVYIAMASVYPNCLQTESAAAWLNWRSHTVPHVPAWYTSTLPLELAGLELLLASVTRRTCPLYGVLNTVVLGSYN